MFTVEEIHEQLIDMGERLQLQRASKAWASADLSRQIHIHFDVVHKVCKQPNDFQHHAPYPCFDITAQLSQDRNTFELFLRRTYPHFTEAFTSVPQLEERLLTILNNEL